MTSLVLNLAPMSTITEPSIAITEAIKLSYLSPYKPGSPVKSQGILNKPTYKPRSYMIQHNQSHVTSQFTNISHTS